MENTSLQIRVWLIVFIVGLVIVGLVISGITAFPLEMELRVAARVLHSGWLSFPQLLPRVVEWVDRVKDALVDTNIRYPFIA